MTDADQTELIRITREAVAVARDFQANSTEAVLAAALINYQAAQMITERLDAINTRLSDLNENFWRSRQQ